MRRLVGWLLAILVLLAAGGAAGWALGHVTDRSDPGQVAAPPVTVAVTSGTVSDELPLTVTAQWPTRPLATNRRAGVVTAVNVSTGDPVRSGDALFAVNLEPVVVAQGKLPLFRDIAGGVRGPDVAQVQRFLATTGFYSGPADGVAGGGTVDAIRAWQRSLGAPVTGVIQPGSVLMIASLPIRAQVDTRVLRVGAELVGGERVVRAFGRRPTFTVRTTDQIAAQLTSTVAISIQHAKAAGTWMARACRVAVDPGSGQTIVSLVGADGGAVCGATCSLVPYDASTTYAASAVTVPPLSGSLVPAATIATDASGGSVVVLADGRRVPVTIRGTVGGIACVTGVDPGQRVRIPPAVGG